MLPQYCGITILIDVRSNNSNREEKKESGDAKQVEMSSRVVNSSSPSFSIHTFAPHSAGQLPRNSRSRHYVQQYMLGATHSGSNRSFGVVASPSTSSMIVHPRSNSPSAISAGDTVSDPSLLDLIRVDSDDGTDVQARMSPPDTDNDDGMQDISVTHNRVVRTDTLDTDNDIDVNGDDATVEDDMLSID